jgi:hypothetical protein
MRSLIMKKLFVIGEYHPIHLYLRANELRSVIPLLEEKNLTKELYRAIKLEKIVRNEAKRILQIEINYVKKKKPHRFKNFIYFLRSLLISETCSGYFAYPSSYPISFRT